VTKTCKDCGETLPIAAFYKNKNMLDGHLNWCKPCNRVRYGDGVKRRAAEFRAYVQKIKVERGCADCGYNAHPAALDFDHLPGNIKLGKLASMACGSSLKTIHAEIAKCDVVCANCHRVRTANRRQKVEVE
jgi:hypothetical protein